MHFSLNFLLTYVTQIWELKSNTGTCPSQARLIYRKTFFWVQIKCQSVLLISKCLGTDTGIWGRMNSPRNIGWNTRWFLNMFMSPFGQCDQMAPTLAEFKGSNIGNFTLVITKWLFLFFLDNKNHLQLHIYIKKCTWFMNTCFHIYIVALVVFYLHWDLIW